MYEIRPPLGSPCSLPFCRHNIETTPPSASRINSVSPEEDLMENLFLDREVISYLGWFWKLDVESIALAEIRIDKIP